MKGTMSRSLRRLITDYGMVVVLLVLGGFFSILTIEDQSPVGAAAARDLMSQMRDLPGRSGGVLIVGRQSAEDAFLAALLEEELKSEGWEVFEVVLGEPPDARAVLQRAAQSGRTLGVIAGTQVTARWLVFSDVKTGFPGVGDPVVVEPRSYRWPNFLKRDNLINIANQIAVIAIVAIGMTMVIITAGIDLSVGSLIAFSAVLCCWVIREVGGALQASWLAMTLSCFGAILACGSVGAFTGGMITLMRIPPFIVTLGMMLVASGCAYILAQGQSVYQVPDAFVWLGRGADVFGIPNAVLLMGILYAGAHVLMSSTRIGRYLYAVGGNVEAARLSGVPVRRVLLFAYVASGLLAGLGGVIMASQLKSGSPTYGLMYELYVIAAVVVGGTSLSGGEGRMLGTLIGAFIIAVIQNGMNLMGIESYTQKVVLGAVILGAVCLDKLKQRDGK